jgi:hypothetical protein
MRERKGFEGLLQLSTCLFLLLILARSLAHPGFLTSLLILCFSLILCLSFSVSLILSHTLAHPLSDARSILFLSLS